MTQTEIAKALNRTPRQIRKLHQRGIPRNEDGTYPWPAAQEWWVKFKQQERLVRTGKADDSHYERARARKTEAQAELAEIDVAVRLGQLVRRDETQAVWFQVMRLARDRLLNLPDQLADPLALEADPEAVRGVLQAAIREALDSAADEIESLQVDDAENEMA